MKTVDFILFCTISIVLRNASSQDSQAKSGSIGPGKQAWNYVEVRPGAHMFWLLYFTTNTEVLSPYEKPLLVWLQGGPGVSSTGFGNFELLGPLDVYQKPRNHSWVKDFNILFIDNPVGTGFSYVDTIDLLTKTNAEIANDLVKLMVGFYEALPEFIKVPTYIIAQSYGGKMAVEFALEWNKAEKADHMKSNLKGVGLGDPWISPIDSVLSWAPYLLQIGMIDKNGAERIEKEAIRAKEAADAGEWENALNFWDSAQNEVEKATKGIDFFNVLSKVNVAYLQAFLETGTNDINSTAPEDSKTVHAAVLKDLMNGSVRTALNINIPWVSLNSSVFESLVGDFMKPATRVVEQLLTETELKIVVYSGQLDLIVDTPGTINWVERLQWKNAMEWLQSERMPVVVNNIVEGTYKSYGNFTFYWIDRAGHNVQVDNPLAMDAILQNLTRP